MVHENKNLDYFIQKYGSRYSATVFVAKEARRLAEKYDNVITHAEALSWILSNKTPEGIKHYKTIKEKRSQKDLQYANYYLSNIQDEDVKSAVLESLKYTKNEGHLIYRYKNVYDKYRQARIRILTNKLWDEMRNL